MPEVTQGGEEVGFTKKKKNSRHNITLPPLGAELYRKVVKNIPKL